MHSLTCNENLTLKVGSIQIRQFLRLHPGSWLETGSIEIPELRLNGKLDCHPSTPTHLNEQLEFLRRHDQHSQRLHFLYASKSHPVTPHPHGRRPSTLHLATSATSASCACLGGSPAYFTLVSGEQFFRSSFRLSEQPSFGTSLFRPDLHVLFSHPIFEHKYTWDPYPTLDRLETSSQDEEIFYPFDFCVQPASAEKLAEKTSMPTMRKSASAFSRTSSARYTQCQSYVEANHHKRSNSSTPLASYEGEASSSSTTIASDGFLTPKERLSLITTSGSSSSSIPEHLLHPSSSPSLATVQRQISVEPPTVTVTSGSEDGLSLSSSSSSDSLAAFEEILEREQRQGRNSPVPSPDRVSTVSRFSGERTENVGMQLISSQRHRQLKPKLCLNLVLPGSI